jgi:hypothetical protein
MKPHVMPIMATSPSEKGGYGNETMSKANLSVREWNVDCGADKRTVTQGETGGDEALPPVMPHTLLFATNICAVIDTD